MLSQTHALLRAHWDVRFVGDPAVRISVCTPTFQGLTRLVTTAPRVLEVLGPDDEIIYSIDGSNDGSEEYLERLAAEDFRVRLAVAPANRGRTVALNAACKLARGEIVLRLDDDILVPDGFFDLHAEAHAHVESPVGVVQSLVEVLDDDPRSRMWREFVERNAEIDRQRLVARSNGLPASAWGAVCSIPREVGERLRWYDESFEAYGWEDIEFGYRLRLDGIQLLPISMAATMHLGHATSFKNKLLRGLDSGARMAVFAQIHGPVAVLEALGLDSSAYERPHVSARTSGLLTCQTARTLGVHVSVVLERVLSAMGWRRGYDWWVARRLDWSRTRGWFEESARRGLPMIEPPTRWRHGRAQTAATDWERILDAASLLPAQSRVYAERVLRSVWLRCLEARKVNLSRRVRIVARTALRVATLVLSSRRNAQETVSRLCGADAWVFVEAPTPSGSDGPVQVARAFEADERSCLVLAATRKAADWVGARNAGLRVEVLEDLAGLRSSGLRGALREVRGARCSVRTLVDEAGVSIPLLGRTQLWLEAAAGALLSEGLGAIPHESFPKLIVSASEYFPPSIVLREAARKSGVPFVTLQHGAVSVVYAPFMADEYWVWTQSAAEALAGMQPTGSVTVVGPYRALPAVRTDRSMVRERMGIHDADAPVLVFFSQTHGPEYSGATQFAVASQLARLRRDLPDCVVVIKRHPAEKASTLEALSRVDERVLVAPSDLSAAEVAAAADVVMALGSTALVDAMSVGCCAIELLTDESIMLEPVAVERVLIAGAARKAANLLSDDLARLSVVHRQSEWLAESGAAAGTFASASAEAARRLIVQGVS